MTTITVYDTVCGEKAGFVEFIVRLSAPSASEVRVNYGTSSGTALEGDYTRASGTLTFARGEVQKIIRVPVSTDDSAESRESFFIELSSPINAVIGKTVATATIIDNDGPTGSPIVTVADVAVDEKAGFATFAVVLDRASARSVTLDYRLDAGSAAARLDYADVSGALRFGAGETVKYVTVKLKDDGRVEGVETFDLVLSNIANASASDLRATAFIGGNDNPDVARPTVSIDDVVVGEYDGYAEFTVRLNAPTTQEVRVSWGTDTGTADSNDYERTGGQIYFAVGETVKTVRVPISDTFSSVERIESFTVNLNTPVGVDLGRSKAIGTIIDNDVVADNPLVSVSNITVDEKSGTATFYFQLDHAASDEIHLSYATVDGTALAGIDYQAANGIVSFAAGDTVQAVTVAINDDNRIEAKETFSLALSDAFGATLSRSAATGTIWESDQSAVARPLISITSANVREGDGFVDLVVSLSAPSQSSVTMNWGTDNGTATGSLNDFVSSGGTLTFYAGEVAKVVRVAIVDDQSVENREMFDVNISNVIGATIGTGTGLVTIIDDDRSNGVFELLHARTWDAPFHAELAAIA